MKVVVFAHSVVSCWNNGNAHFLRGVCRELIASGHDVHVLEPVDGWSRLNALRDGGAAVLAEAARLVPGLSITLYDAGTLDVARATHGAALVLVHEWTEPRIVARIAAERLHGGRFTLLFHDTHHRAITAPREIDRLPLDCFDGILAFGASLRELYAARGWGARAVTWHEAADTALFRQPEQRVPQADIVWIGNWGDEERAAEIDAYIVRPVSELGLSCTVHGVRYAASALDALCAAGIAYRGWLPNHKVPRAFAAARATIHVPRGPYAALLPGIPTIRMFEALACGIPLVSAPWDDVEGLFPRDCYLRARDPGEAAACLRSAVHDHALREELIARGLAAVRARHTCVHRVRELLAVHGALAGASAPATTTPSAIAPSTISQGAAP